MEEEPKRRGRKKAFKRDDGRAGAPQITLRLSPPVLDRVRNHPEGSRVYVERLVAEDCERTGEPLGGVPGQMKMEHGGNELGDG